MDVFYIDIASLDDPDNLSRICIRKNITMKELIDHISSILRSEVYRLYLDNRRLIDLNDIYERSIIYAALNISPDKSCSEYQKIDADVITEFDTFFTDDLSHLKTVVLGENNSGKTSYILRLIHNRYDDTYIPTSIAAEFYHTLNIEGIAHSVSILDTTDKFVEEFDRDWILDRNLFIITISVEQLYRWKLIIIKYMALLSENNNILVILMITKADLLDHLNKDKRRRLFILLGQLERYAEQNNLIVFRTSAKSNKKINGPFLFAIKRLQSFNYQTNSDMKNFDYLYYKVPAVFILMDRFVSLCKKKFCRT